MNVAERPKLSFATLAKASAVGTAVGGVSLHLMGYVANQTYLSRMGVNADMFPRATDWLVFNGYFTYFDRLTYMLKVGLFKYWFLVAILVFLTATYFAFEGLASDHSPAQPRPFEWFRTKYPRLVNFIGSHLKAVLVAVAILYVVIATSLLVLMPAAGGQAAGNDQAGNHLKRFATVCAASKACSEITVDGVLVGRGYIVAASENRVAYFDPELQQTVTRELHGLLVTTPPEPEFWKRERP